MKELYVALDFKREEETWDFLDQFKNNPIPVKIGMSQFYMSGADFVKKLADRGHKIFLDLKCHDIPNTVYLAMLQLSQLPVDLVTIHTLGGREMMEAAVQGAKEGKYQPKVLGITQLTSMDQNTLSEIGIKNSLIESVQNLAQLAQKSGLDGVVSSVQEVPQIKEVTGEDFLCLCPGIRMKKDASGDQKRVASPNEARELGADYIVVGRPITQAKNPVVTYNEFLNDWKGDSNEL